MTVNLPSEDVIRSLPKDGGDQYNRLIFEDSLYLKSHAHQKINWYSWGQSAFDLARLTNKPLFLSIGYSSCHWCHVMSEKTFDRIDVAEKLNDHFVSIKIDRDRHPDIDQMYMNATQLLTEHGGWPNSIFCLPTGQPFFAGTYFPPEDHSKGPGFLTLLDQLSQAWEHNHEDIVKQAEEIERVIQKMNDLQREPHQSMMLQTGYLNAFSAINQRLDTQYGGCLGAPKFPPYATLRLLMAEKTFDHVHLTLEQMALSGLYDQVEGGFHRYSTDNKWHLPHFEKMLLDNAQMIEIYSLMHEHEPRDLYERIVSETIEHLMSHWRLPNGGFLSTIDADTDGGEGHYYVVGFNELDGLADESVVQEWRDYFQFTTAGNMLDEATGQPTGFNIFHPKSESPIFDLAFFRSQCSLFRKQHRHAPQKDFTFVISSNAWLAKALYIAARVFANESWRNTADELMAVIKASIKANSKSVYLNDVVYALSAELEKGNDGADGEFYWQILMTQFYDMVQGGLWFSQLDHRTPMSRIKDIYDRAEPAPNGVFIDCAVKLYQRTKLVDYYEKALDTLDAFLTTVQSSSLGCESYWLGVQTYWNTLPSDNGCRVQRSFCSRETDDVIAIQLDLQLENGRYLIDKTGVSINGDAEWLQRTIDPIKSRRMDWSDDIVSCATGAVRFQGRCRLSNISSSITLKLSICSDDACFSPFELDVPVLS